MCGGCGKKSVAVRVARNVSKNKLKALNNGVIVMRQGVKKKAKPPQPKPPQPKPKVKRFKSSSGVRAVRNGR